MTLRTLSDPVLLKEKSRINISLSLLAETRRAVLAKRLAEEHFRQTQSRPTSPDSDQTSQSDLSEAIQVTSVTYVPNTSPKTPTLARESISPTHSDKSTITQPSDNTTKKTMALSLQFIGTRVESTKAPTHRPKQGFFSEGLSIQGHRV
ncbi:MAG: hypothetical protein K1060chlam5_00352 [Candidatus Anoxychlamydiales bacterium]|nr:hypothetical protein [Candidatus Anoxychlamydiales bacterium]